jgi:tetratricopeptide (TPR) repeat protein
MPERAQAQTSMDPVTFAEAEPQISDSGMSDAYQAYQRQDYETALRIYQSVVQFDPYHRDASLGAAASAYRLADYVLAEQLYRHLLSLDALDGAAFAGLLNLVQQNPQRGIIELELQQHAEQHGRPSPLIMLLGNHFARLGRWRDAEVAFSQALQERSDDPDLVFNYAVVLDNLGQRQRAASYYQAAVEASTTSAHSFDLEGAKKRLQSLLSG